jgi:hypothetical protein
MPYYLLGKDEKMLKKQLSQNERDLVELYRGIDDEQKMTELASKASMS